MSDLLDVLGHKMGTMGEDFVVRDAKNAVRGHVTLNGEVFSVDNKKVGYFLENGYIYKGTSHVGTVNSTGDIVDYENQHIGRVTGGHVMLGAAALLLLLR